MRTIIAICIFSVLFAGCKKKIEDSDKSPVKLGASVASTKAPATNGDVLGISVVGWEAADKSIPTYGKSNWISTASFRVSDYAQYLPLTPEQYYNPSEAYKTYIKAVYPQGKIDNDGVLLFRNSVEELMSGTVDVMVTDTVSGSKLDTKAKNLTFRHLLSQLKFMLVSRGSFATTMTVRSIIIKDAEFARGIDFKNDGLVTFGKGDFSVANIQADAQFELNEKRVGDSVMMKPFAQRTFNAVIQAELKDANGTVTTMEPKPVVITIDKDPSFKPGKTYVITIERTSDLTVEIGVGMVKVSDWGSVENGKIDIDR